MRRFGFSLIIIYIIFVVIVQLALATESVRPVFTQIDKLEGLSSSVIIDNIGTCEVELTIRNFTMNNNVKILVNGRVAGYFTQPSVRIAVRDNALIEIDARGIEENREIYVSGTSSNTADFCRNLSVTASNNIAVLGKIYVGDEKSPLFERGWQAWFLRLTGDCFYPQSSVSFADSSFQKEPKIGR